MKQSLQIVFIWIGLMSFSNASYGAEKKITYGGFVDLQYAFDFNAPANGDRVFTTQPARHNEFNVNLAFLELQYQTEKIRSRLSLQAGTSVQANYSAEPTNGTVSGDELSRHIQEARIGYQLFEKTWIDAGVFFSHVGAEGWISKDNLTLSRSLVADYSPYYLSGLRVSHNVNDSLNLLFLVTNGWQNISENNSDKTIGTGVEYLFNSLSVAYNTLIGNEVSPNLNGLPRSSRFRHFHDLLIKSRGLEDWEWVAQYDFGFQKSENRQSTHSWQGAVLMSRYKLN
ncbi:porin [bacterium]|nr:porin [bacterium]